MLNLKGGLPAFVKSPHFNYSASRAIAPNFEAVDMYIDNSDGTGTKMLKTMRGLGPLYGDKTNYKLKADSDSSLRH